MSRDFTEHVVSGAIGGGATLFFRYILGEIALRWLRRGEFALDGIVDLMATITGIERQLEDDKTSPDHLGPVHNVQDLPPASG
jgi:hypothetical protein